jgi:hypothetical protein
MTKRTPKVKLSLRLIKDHVMKTYGGVEVYLHAFSTSEIQMGDPGRFTSRIKPRVAARHEAEWPRNYGDI